jgi:hypothetical protein
MHEGAIKGEAKASQHLVALCGFEAKEGPGLRHLKCLERFPDHFNNVMLSKHFVQYLEEVNCVPKPVLLTIVL